METLVKAIAVQKITVDGVEYAEGSECKMTQQRFDSYLTVGAVQLTIPKYLGIEEPKLSDRPVLPSTQEEF